MGLVQGSPLTITRHNSTSLMISVDRAIAGKGILDGEEDVVVLSIPASEATETTALKIGCLYVQGHNLIKVKFAENPLTSARRTAIRELIRRHLIGVEIVSDSSDDSGHLTGCERHMAREPSSMVFGEEKHGGRILTSHVRSLHLSKEIRFQEKSRLKLHTSTSKVCL